MCMEMITDCFHETFPTQTEADIWNFSMVTRTISAKRPGKGDHEKNTKFLILKTGIE